MEIQVAQNEVSTKEREKNTDEFVSITAKEAEEYRGYKRQQKIAEITGAISRSGTRLSEKENAEKVLQQAARFCQATVRMSPLQLCKLKGKLTKRSVQADCIVGGNGETTAKVKAYEARLAKRMGAKELTLVLAPSMIFSCSYGEIRKELKKIKRAAGKCVFKVWVDNKYPFPTLARIARICSEMGVLYFCVPQFPGCERLRYDLSRECSLEVSEVENLEDFKKMARVGVRRIVTSHIFDIYTEWIKEVEEFTLSTEKTPIKMEEKPSTELKIV